MKNIRLVRIGIGVLTFGVMAATSLAAPSVSSFSPALGKPGTQVVISGADFTSATKVEFDATVADFVVTAANRIVTTVPPDATTGKIRVSVSQSVFGESSASFVVAPRITEVDPPRSATNIFVTIRGFNFTNATQVLFSNNRTSTFSITAATQIRARVPFGATNGPVTVVTPAGSATTTDAFVVTGPAPEIDSFSP
ncbi:MAG TPA: IPT/TIG domain-containing protein, partial [Verrucomicrobiae bacterium]|nr:IPT/TIG domain-containing protein [Verrucomicrobiae bacterium]